MGERHRGAWFIAACGLVVIAAAVGCSRERGDRNINETQTPSTAAEPRDQQKGHAMTLVGCLQQGDGRNDFILTEDNTARDITGTAGSTASAERQRLEAAAKSYRLTEAKEDLKAYVGKQVRVAGILDEPSDVPTSGEQARTGEEPKIRERDLARVEVRTIELVADSCGSSKGGKR